MRSAVHVVCVALIAVAQVAAAMPSDADLLRQAERAAADHIAAIDARVPQRGKSWIREAMGSAILCSSSTEDDWTAQCLVVSRERNTFSPSWSSGSEMLVTLAGNREPQVHSPGWEGPLSGAYDAWQDTLAAVSGLSSTLEGRRRMAEAAIECSETMRHIVAQSACAEWHEVDTQLLLLDDHESSSSFLATILLEHPSRTGLRAAAMAKVTIWSAVDVSLAPVTPLGSHADTLMLRFLPELRPGWGVDAGSPGCPALYVFAEYGHGNILDTYAGTYTKDMIAAVDTTVALTLDPGEQARVLEKAEEIGFFACPLFVERDAGVRISPDSSPDMIRLRTSSKDRAVFWSYPLDPDSSHAAGLVQLRNLIRSIVEAKAAYKELPAPRGGYM